MKKRLAVLLILSALLLTLAGSVSAQTTAEKEELYNGAVKELEVYLADLAESSDQLSSIARTLDELRGFRHSRFLKYYVLCLKLITEEDFGAELSTYLILLNSDKSFISYLEQEDLGLGTLEQLQQYAEARRMEHKETSGTRPLRILPVETFMTRPSAT